MLRTRVITSLVTPLAVLAAATACGGNGDGEVGNLSKGAFAAKANTLCERADAERAPLLQQLPAAPSGEADAQTLDRAADIDRELLRQVDDLVPPEAEQDRVDRLLDVWRQRADLEDQYADAVGAMQEPQSLANLTASLAQLDATAAPIANELGMTECARAPS